MMESKLNKYKKLVIPENSAWDRKSYDPILWLYKTKSEWPDSVETAFDFWFVPKNWVRDFIRFIARLKVWLPVLWRDRDWDDFFIFEMLKTKLFTQRKYLVENNRHQGITEINRDITICLNLIDRFQNSYYEVEYFDYYDFDILFSEVEDGLSEMKSHTLMDNLVEYIDKYPLDRKRAIEDLKKMDLRNVDDYRENPESRRYLAMHIGGMRHLKCKRLIFLIISHKIVGWWD